MSVCYYVLFWNIDFPPGSIARHFYAPLKTFNQCRMRKTMTYLFKGSMSSHCHISPYITYVNVILIFISYDER